MRAFIAIPLPKEIKDYLYELQQEISRLPAKFRFVHKKNLHLTIKFIRGLQPKDLEELKSRLKTIKFNAFKTKLQGTGLFPGKKFARVIWVGLDAADRVNELQKRIDEKLIDLFPDNQEFNSHLTIGRIKLIKNKEKFSEELEKIKVKSLQFEVKEFCLYKSTLTKDGPIYEVIEEYKLN